MPESQIFCLVTVRWQAPTTNGTGAGRGYARMPDASLNILRATASCLKTGTSPVRGRPPPPGMPKVLRAQPLQKLAALRGRNWSWFGGAASSSRTCYYTSHLSARLEPACNVFQRVRVLIGQGWNVRREGGLIVRPGGVISPTGFWDWPPCAHPKVPFSDRASSELFCVFLISPGLKSSACVIGRTGHLGREKCPPLLAAGQVGGHHAFAVIVRKADSALAAPTNSEQLHSWGVHLHFSQKKLFWAPRAPARCLPSELPALFVRRHRCDLRPERDLRTFRPHFTNTGGRGHPRNAPMVMGFSVQ
eukprot:gene22235-biopygen19234